MRLTSKKLEPPRKGNGGRMSERDRNKAISEDLFDESSRINNELVNAQRESSRQKAELQKQHERLRSLIAALPHAHIVLDESGTIMFANAAARDLLTPKDARKGEKFPLPVNSEPGAELEYETSEGLRIVELYVSLIWWGEQRSRLITLIDVTQKKKAQEQITRKEKLQGVLEMAGSAAHHLSQPLQSMISDVEYLLDEVELDGLEDTEASIRSRMSELTDLMRKIQRITRYELADYSEDLKIIDIDKSSS
jgi:nitrogen-specific signal transduction histidine kinase